VFSGSFSSATTRSVNGGFLVILFIVVFFEEVLLVAIGHFIIIVIDVRSSVSISVSATRPSTARTANLLCGLPGWSSFGRVKVFVFGVGLVGVEVLEDSLTLADHGRLAVERVDAVVQYR
jgi:hypothetical protein